MRYVRILFKTGRLRAICNERRRRHEAYGEERAALIYRRLCLLQYLETPDDAMGLVSISLTSNGDETSHLAVDESCFLVLRLHPNDGKHSEAAIEVVSIKVTDA